MSIQPTAIRTFVSEELVRRIHNTGDFSVPDNIDGVDGNEILARIGNVASRRHLQENLPRHGVSRRTNVATVLFMILVLRNIADKSQYVRCDCKRRESELILHDVCILYHQVFPLFRRRVFTTIRKGANVVSYESLNRVFSERHGCNLLFACFLESDRACVSKQLPVRWITRYGV